MHTNHPREDPLVELGYEIRDVNYKSLYRTVIYFFIFAGASAFAGLLLYNWWYPPQSRSTAANAAGMARAMPGKNYPLLQDNVTSKTDIMDLRKGEAARLHGTGYVDDSHTKAHIPIDRAMDLLVERGLPKVSASVPAVTRGNTTDQVPDAAPAGTPETGVPASTGSTTPAH